MANAQVQNDEVGNSLVGVLSNVLEGSGVEGGGGNTDGGGVVLVESTTRRLSDQWQPPSAPPFPPTPSVPFIEVANVTNITINVTELGMLASTVERSIGLLSTALLAQAVNGEQNSVAGEKIALLVRRDTPSALANLTFTPGGTNASMFVEGDPIVTLPSTFDHGGDFLDVQLTSYALPSIPPVASAHPMKPPLVPRGRYGLNVRGYSPSARTICRSEAECFNGIASNSTTLTLRRGSEELTTQNVSDPFLLTFKIAMPAGLSATSPTCTGPRDAALCNTTIGEIDQLLREYETNCTRTAARNKLWSDIGILSFPEQQFAQCMQNLGAYEATLLADKANCSNILAPCNGHGNCTGGTAEGVDSTGDVCVCDEGWHGGQCDFRPSCQYWDPELGELSTAGCTLQSYEPSTGQVVCACNHLTEFGTAFRAIINTNETWGEVFFTFPYNLTLPATSWGDLFNTLGDFGVEMWLWFSLWLALTLLALFVLHVRDERQLHTGFMPMWHKLMTCSGIDSRRTPRFGRRFLRFLRLMTIFTVWFLTNHQVRDLPRSPSLHDLP